MDIVHIKTSSCSIGEILAADIINSKGVKLVTRNTTINDYIKGKLLELGIEDIYIYDQKDFNIQTYSDIRDTIFSSVASVKKILNDLVSGKSLDYVKVANISDMIYSVINRNEPVIQYLNEIKKADEYTYTHCINAAFYSMLLAKWMKLSESQIKKAIQAGLLHDVGKIKTPVEILNKKGILTKAEYEEIKKHTLYGYKIIDNLDSIDEDVKEAVLMHHERQDGSGYPYGLKSDSLNIYARIVAIADVFDAMTTDRVYKKKVTPFEVFELFTTAGDYMFDAAMIRIFMSNLAPHYIGSKVLLNNGEIGEIVYIYPYDVTVPIVKVDSHYVPLAENKVRILDIL